MSEEFSRLFEPVTIGNIEIKNRIAMAPMAILGLVATEGGFSKRAADYYIERAKGECGLIITGAVKVENEIEKLLMPSFPCLTLNPFHFIQSTSEMTEQIHAYGSKIFIQLTAGLGHNAVPAILEGHPISPSATPYYWDQTVRCRELTTEEVEKLVKKFGEAAGIAAMAGFDGIEVHAMHEGYLIDQFTMSMFNKRTDKYGGDLKGRLTLPIEILREIKGTLGKDFPVQLRFSIKSYLKDWSQGGVPGEEFEEKGRDIEESLEAARILEAAGYNAFNADAGTYQAWYWAHPPRYMEHGCYLPLTEKLKKAVGVPVMAAGRMEIPELAKKAIEQNKADLVMLGRGLLADPYWPRKVMEGKTEKIRPCLGCHDGCLGRLTLGRPISCAVNPSCGREKEYALQSATVTKNVMVIGGGIAGMEAARVVALRGHRVTLYEKTDKLGGHLIEAAIPDFKDDEERLLGWYKTELSDLNVKINLNTEVTPDIVQEKKIDAVIIATGSRPVMPDISGIGKDSVVTATDLLLGKKKAGENVVIAGGGLIGCETALWLARQGKNVTIVEMAEDILLAGPQLCHANSLMILDLLKFHKINILTNAGLSEITEDGVVVTDKSCSKNRLSVDTVVIATGLKSDQELYRSIAATVPNLYVIGDARQPRNIMNCIWDAYEIARNI